MVVLVEEVTFEKLLSCRVLEVNFILFYSFFIFPLLIVNVILVKVFCVLIGNVRRLNSKFV